jgi:squalene-associated FAD-dependent desaturase
VHEGDISVSQLLERFGQPPVLVQALWEPLCIAALNVDPAQACARTFARVLHESFATTRAASDLLVPRRPLGDVLPGPGAHYIAAHGGEVRLGERALGLEAAGPTGTLTVRTEREALDAHDVVVATSPIAAERLLGNFPQTAEALSRLNALGDEPIVTVYLQYAEDTRLDTPMIGLRDTVAQWVFDRRVAGQPGLLAVVISAQGEHMDLDNTALASAVAAELARVFTHLGPPRDSLVIREKRATFRCLPGSDAHRPGNRTVRHGLWLAGDYTDTGLPATLEGAVRSGLECAHAILKRRNIEIKAC